MLSASDIIADGEGEEEASIVEWRLLFAVLLLRDNGDLESEGPPSASSLAASFEDRAEGDKASSASIFEFASETGPGSEVDCHNGADTMPAASRKIIRTMRFISIDRLQINAHLLAT